MSASGVDTDIHLNRVDVDLREESATTYYTGTVRIPGYRPSPHRCRPLQPVGFCEHGHTLLGRSSCGTRYCSDHWRDWCQDAVVSMVARLAAYREVQEGAGKRLVHVVASPPQDRRYSEDSLYGTRSEAYDVLEEVGVRGGAVVTHPYRTSEAGNRLYEAAKDSGAIPEEGVGRWRFLRESSDDWEELERYVEASPHYHGLAAVEDLDVSDRRDGWVVKNIRSFSRFHRWDTESYRDMAKTAYYVLTHSAESGGRQATTYFGEVHPSVFSPEEELTAAAWDRIQLEAEKAVKGGAEGESGELEECPREGCSAVVRSLIWLRDMLADSEFVRGVQSHQGGYVRWLRLRGLLAWSEGRTDNPPPGAATSEARMLDWLEARGRALTPEPSQVSLTAAVAGRE